MRHGVCSGAQDGSSGGGMCAGVVTQRGVIIILVYCCYCCCAPARDVGGGNKLCASEAGVPPTVDAIRISGRIVGSCGRGGARARGSVCGRPSMGVRPAPACSPESAGVIPCSAHGSEPQGCAVRKTGAAGDGLASHGRLQASRPRWGCGAGVWRFGVASSCVSAPAGRIRL